MNYSSINKSPGGDWDWEDPEPVEDMPCLGGCKNPVSPYEGYCQECFDKLEALGFFDDEDD